MIRAIILGIVVFVTASAAQAESADITQEMIERKNARLEQALNDRDDAMGTIKALHEHISDNARFKLTVTNPNMQSGKSPVMQMDKSDYINTYIQGTHFVAGYNIDIKTERFEYDPAQHQAYTLDTLTERGTMMSSLNRGKPFISRTTCRTMHEIQKGTLVATAGECHTDISFEEEI